jgi:hypothetical protein
VRRPTPLPTLFPALVLALVLASCVGEGIVPPQGGSPCDGWGEPHVVGRVAESALTEISGVVASRAHPGIIWVHNDSDAAPVLWALDGTGATVATLGLTGAQAYDWEASSLGPGPGGDYLYVADTGDNLGSRSYGVLYRVPEPAEVSGSLQGVAEALEVTYPDRPRNVEAMFVDPATGDAYLIAKVLLGPAPVYRVPASAWDGGEVVAERVATLDLGLLPATAADLSADGTVLAVRTYAAVLLLSRPEGTPLAAVFEADPCHAPAPPEAQGEAITWDGGGYLTIGEGSAAPIYRVSR